MVKKCKITEFINNIRNFLLNVHLFELDMSLKLFDVRNLSVLIFSYSVLK